MSTYVPPTSANRRMKAWAIAAVVVSYLKCFTWHLFTKGPFLLVNEEIVTQGLIHLFPPMGKKLWKTFGMAFMDNYELTFKLTIAHVFAFVALVFTMLSWHLLLFQYIAPARFEEKYRRYDVTSNRNTILGAGLTIILADAAMFAAAFAMSSWGSSTLTPSAVLATFVYTGMMAFAALFSLYLSDELTINKQRLNEHEQNITHPAPASHALSEPRVQGT